VTERRRAELRQASGTPEEWLRSLSIVVTVESLNAANVARVVGVGRPPAAVAIRVGDKVR